MKKIILNSFLILGFSLIGISQDNNITMKVTKINEVLTNDNNDYSSGTAPFLTTAYSGSEVIIDIDIENNSGSTISWRASRLNLSNVPSTWTNFYCCAGQCFLANSSNPWCTPSSYMINLANGEVAHTSFHVMPNEIGTGTFTLRFGDCTTFEDSISVTIDRLAGIKELNHTPSFSMYPNPANELVSIQLNNSKNGTVKIVDLVGNVIYSEAISSSKTLNTSEFKNGIYFVTIESEGNKMTSRKLVVRH